MRKNEDEYIAGSIVNLNPKSRAKRIRILLKKNQGLLKDKLDMVEFKEPVVFLIRRSRMIEFYEDASKGTFTFTHSNGDNREIFLDPSGLLTFEFGKKKFKGYILHEDSPLPLPENPLVMADTFNDLIEKAMMDNKKLDLRKREQNMKAMKTLAIFLICAFIVFMAWKGHWIEGLIDRLFGTHLYPEPITQTINNTLEAVSNG